MKINNPGGKIYFFKSDKSQNPKDCFTPLLEVNSNFDNLKSLHLGNGKAFGITVNNELLEWEFEKKQKAKNLPRRPRQIIRIHHRRYLPRKIKIKKMIIIF